MAKARTKALVRPSPWGGEAVEATVVANDHSLIITDGQQQLDLRAADLSAKVNVGVLQVTSPELPYELEVDVASQHDIAPNHSYLQLERVGFRDVLAVLEGAGAQLTLHGYAELHRKSNTFTTWIATPLLGICEGVLAGVGGDVLGRALGGHLSDSTATSAVLAVLILLAVAGGLFAIPYRALYATTAVSQSVVGHYDTASMRAGGHMGALWAGALPFLRREAMTSHGTAFSVLPWLPVGRLEMLGACVAVTAYATATDDNLDDGWAGGTLGGIARLVAVILVVVTYYLPSSAPVEVSLKTALQVRNARAIAYAAFLVFGIAALALGN